MALTAVNYLLRAHEAKMAARMSPDKTLSELFLKIAQSYEALAENEEWLEGKRCPATGVSLSLVGAGPSSRVPSGGRC